MLAEAGTGVGKTLGYLAPASLWAEANGPAVWVSTYTRALQRQIERESHAIYPDPARARPQGGGAQGAGELPLPVEPAGAGERGACSGAGDLIGTGAGGALGAGQPRRRHDRRRLPGLAAGPVRGRAGGAGRRRPIWSTGAANASTPACPHYRVCFIEKAVRASRRADLVIANHALVLTQAAFDGARAARGPEDRRRDHRAQADRVRRGPPPVRRRRRRLRRGPVGRRGRRAAPLDPRAGGAGPPRARAGAAAGRPGRRPRGRPRGAASRRSAPPPPCRARAGPAASPRRPARSTRSARSRPS